MLEATDRTGRIRKLRILRITVVSVALLVVAVPSFAEGSPAVGWVTIGGPAPNTGSGSVTLTAYGYQVTYYYYQSDTTQSVVQGLAAMFNNPSSPVSASTTDNTLSLTSKATGLTANSSSALFATSVGPSFSPSIIGGMIGGRDGARNFQMSLFYQSGTDADVGFTNVPFPVPGPSPTPTPQPPGHSVLNLQVGRWSSPNLAQMWAEFVNSNTIDLTRVDAIYVDEPYATYLRNQHLSTSSSPTDPCSDSRVVAMGIAYELLRTAAEVIRQYSPHTRFWVNFGQPETDWLRTGSCSSLKLANGTHVSLDAPYINVVSLDWYNADFNTTVKPVYDWFVAQPQPSWPTGSPRSRHFSFSARYHG